MKTAKAIVKFTSFAGEFCYWGEMWMAANHCAPLCGCPWWERGKPLSWCIQVGHNCCPQVLPLEKSGLSPLWETASFFCLICLALPDNRSALFEACLQFLASYSLIFHLQFLLPSRLLVRDQIPCLSRPPIIILVQFLSCMQLSFVFSCLVLCTASGSLACFPAHFTLFLSCFGPLFQSAPLPPLGLALIPAVLQMHAFHFLAALPCQHRKDGRSPLQGLEPLQFEQPWKWKASWAPLFPGWPVFPHSVGRCWVAIGKTCNVRACPARKNSWVILVIYSSEVIACHGYAVYYYCMWVYKLLSVFSMF